MAQTRRKAADYIECTGFHHDWQYFLPLEGDRIFDIGFSKWDECTVCDTQREVVYDGLGHLHHRNYYYSDGYKAREVKDRAAARVIWAKANGHMRTRAPRRRAA